MKNIKQKLLKKAAIISNNLLASDFSKGFERWFGSLTESKPTIFDIAVDAPYNANHVGSWMHRLFDGHQPLEMWETIKNVKMDDSRKEELFAYIETFFKDFNTPAGLPFFTYTKDGYDKAVIFLNEKFHIPKDWFYDFNTLNGAELVASSISVLAVIFSWNSKDKKLFGDLISSLMTAGAIGGNPITMIIAIIVLGRHINLEKNKSKFSKKFLDGIKKGSIGSLLFISTSAFVGGPVWIGLVLGLIIAIIFRKNSDKFNIKSVYEWFRDSLKSLFSSAYNTLV